MGPMLIILSEIISYEGSSVSQCMRRLTAPDGAGGGGASVRSFRHAYSQTQRSLMRMVTLVGEGGGGASVRSLRLTSPTRVNVGIEKIKHQLFGKGMSNL
jgi:hypothetical protein